MAEEKKEEVKTESTTVTPTTQEKKDEEIVIPKARFDEVNQAKKELEDKLAKIEADKKAAEEAKLKEDGKTKELLEIREQENAKLKLDILKRDLIQDAVTNSGLNPRLSAMVAGDTEEAIKSSITKALEYQKEIEDGIKADKTATDKGAGNGNNSDFKVLTTQEYMELYNKDPKEADKYLKELTARKTAA